MPDLQTCRLDSVLHVEPAVQQSVRGEAALWTLSVRSSDTEGSFGQLGLVCSLDWAAGR